MRILITTIGTRGDVQLYIPLSKGLIAAGHDVSIATHPWAKDLLQMHSIAHYAVGSDVNVIDKGREAVECYLKGLSGLKDLMTSIYESLCDCHSGFLEACKSADLIIGHNLIGKAEADILNKLFVTVNMVPMGVPKKSWGSKNFFKNAIYELLKIIGTNIFPDPFTKFRKKVYIPIKRDKDKVNHKKLNLIPITHSMVKTNDLWEPITEITGYFFTKSTDDYSPPTELMNFMKNNKPLFITFGSMVHSKELSQSLFSRISEAIAISKDKAIVLMAGFDREAVNIPENIFLIESVPYEWILKQVSIVIHHFGFGTTAEVLKVGLKSIPIPHFIDQDMRAKEMYKLGLCSKPLKLKSFTGKQLADEILKIKDGATMGRKIETISKTITEEDGVNKAIKLINQFLK